MNPWTRNKTVDVVVYIEVKSWFTHRSQLYVVHFTYDGVEVERKDSDN
jgi:hypothetical protein